MKSFLIEPLEARIAPATLTVSPTSGVEGDTDSLPLKFTIRLSEAATTDVQVDYATIDGSALAGSDYQSTQGTLMFPAGTTELMVSVPVIGDTLVEANEGFSLRLSNAVGASLSATPQAAGTIIDDDRTISIAPRTVQEGDPATQALTFTVTLSAAAQSPIAVKYNTADGTATAGEDYTAVTNGTVNFGVGDISKTITISTVGDTRFEADENFKVQLTAVQGDGARLSTDPAGREALGTLTNDDQPPAITSALRVVEGQNAVFTVTLPQALSSAISVPYTTRDGTALDGVDDPAGTVADYTKTSGTLIIPAGQTTAQIVVPVLADALADRGETFTLELGAGAFLRTSTVTIFDAGLSVGDASVTEGQSGTRDAVFTVTLSAAQAEAVTFNYATENGTAIAGSDYTAVSGSLTIPAGATTATIAVPVSGDAVNETDEAFRLRLTLPDTATIGLIDAEATGTIVSDDVAIAVSISDASITEGDSGFSTAVFVVSLSEPVPAGQTRTVHFQTENVGGVESSGAFADYEAIPSGSVVFEAGQTVKTIPVKVFGDRLWEPGNEQFRVRLIDQLVTNTSTNATQTLPVDKVGTGTIVNDDAQPTVSIADVSKLEGDSGNSDAEFRVTLSNPTREGVVIHYSTVAGTATAGTDFDPATDQQITIAPGAMEGTIKVPIVGDVTIEGSETFSVQLASATVQNAAATSLALADGTAVGTIRDDDPRVTIAPATITEGDSGTQQMLFTVRLSAPVPATGGPVTVKYATQDGTAPDGAAKAGEDYIAVGDGTLVFAAGEQEKTIAIAVVGDTRFEQATETFKVLLTSVTGFSATLGNSDATGTITDADPLPTISPSLRVVEGGNAVFTLTIPTAAEADISVPYLTKDGTAIDGVNDGASAVADYAARAGTATILKGQTSATVSIPVFNDVAADSGETFTVEFGSDTRVQTRTVTITEVGASIDDTFVVEGNAGSAKSALFTVRLSAPLAADATFAYQLAGGTATAGTDFDATGGTVTVLAGQTTATISVPIIGDATVEPDETFTVRLLDSTNPAVALSDDTATGTIRNDESVFAISAVDGTDTVTVSEEGNDAARLVTLKITRSGDTSKPASAHYRTVDGVAGADVRGATGDSSRADFAAVADGVVNFAIGETSKTITVQVNGDDRFENKERFSVALVESLSSNAAVSETQGAATVVITETDAVPTVSVTGATIAEPSAAGESGNLAFTVTLSAANEVNAVTLNYATIDGTAKAPGDYTALPATALIFAAGETSKTVLVAVKGDAVDEATEQFSLELSGATNATFGLAGTEPRTKLVAAGTITDNDAPPLLSIGDITVGEGGSAVFSVTLSAPSERAVFVQYVLADGTAKGGADFGVGTPETLSFAPGETSKTISVPTTDDLLFEATENFTVRLVNPQNAALSDSTATGAILDNDSAVLTISDVQVDEGGPGAQTRMLFTVQRSGFLGQTVSVSYVAIDGTAVRTGPDRHHGLSLMILCARRAGCEHAGFRAGPDAENDRGDCLRRRREGARKSGHELRG